MLLWALKHVNEIEAGLKKAKTAVDRAGGSSGQTAQNKTLDRCRNSAISTQAPDPKKQKIVHNGDDADNEGAASTGETRRGSKRARDDDGEDETRPKKQRKTGSQQPASKATSKNPTQLVNAPPVNLHCPVNSPPRASPAAPEPAPPANLPHPANPPPRAVSPVHNRLTLPNRSTRFLNSQTLHYR
ncbi:hypothetical protein VTI74DRAFT_3792 [Chaetomium olivicolor]